MNNWNPVKGCNCPNCIETRKGNNMADYIYYDPTSGDFQVGGDPYKVWAHYNYHAYYASSTDITNFRNDGTLTEAMLKQFNIKGDTAMAKAKNKEVGKKHYVVRDTSVGLVGDNFLTLDDAKDAAAKQFKTKKFTGIATSREIVVYESVACIKEPVPAVDWVTM